MKAAQILRLAVIAEIGLIPVGVVVSFWADGFLPNEILTIKDSQTNPFAGMGSIGPGTVFGMVAVFVVFAAWLVSMIGLLTLRRWGAWLYLASALLAPPFYFLFGIDVSHPIDQVFDDFYRLIPGFIIGLAFFSDAIPPKNSESPAPKPLG